MSLKFDGNLNLGDISPLYTKLSSGEKVQSSLQKKVESATSEVFEPKSSSVINHPITNMEVKKKTWSNKTVGAWRQVMSEKSVDELLKALEDPGVKLSFDFNTDRVDAVAKKNSICGKAGSSSSALNSFNAMIHFIMESNLSVIEKQEKLEKFSKLPWPAEVLKYEKDKYGIGEIRKGSKVEPRWGTPTYWLEDAKKNIQNSINWGKKVVDFEKNYKVDNGKDHNDNLTPILDEFFKDYEYSMKILPVNSSNGLIKSVPKVTIEYTPFNPKDTNYSEKYNVNSESFNRYREQLVIPIDDEAAIIDFINKWNEKKNEAVQELKKKIEIGGPLYLIGILNKNGLALQYASSLARDDFHTVMRAVRQNGLALQFASPRLRNDPVVVKVALGQNGLALQYASEELKGDHLIVRHAIDQSPAARSFVPANVLESIDLSIKHIKLKQVLQRKNLNHDKQILRKIVNQSPQLRRQMASEVTQTLNLRSPTVMLSPYIREPIENLTKAANLEPLEKMSKLVSYERFVSALRTSFSDTLATILQSPPEEQEYVILADESGKSTNWVASHVLDIMSKKQPQAIVTRGELAIYLLKNPYVKHIVMMDDGAYSGDQASGYIQQELYGFDQNILHICIPFMTRYAKNAIYGASSAEKIVFSESTVMFSYNDLARLGYYVQKEMPRPDIIDFIKVPLVQSEGLPPQQMEELNTLNRKVTEFKHKIFRIDDAHIKTEFKEFKLAFEKLSSDLSKIQMSPVNNDLLAVIVSLNEYATIFKEADTDRLGVTGKDEKNYPDNKTGTWMAHKSGDDHSTNYYSMVEAAGYNIAIEPYKEGSVDLGVTNENPPKNIEGRLADLREYRLMKLPHGILEGLTTVESNRGTFLLSDNYLEKSTIESDVYLIIGNEKIPFGGPNGAYQFKLEPDMSFVIQKGETSTAYKFENGKITKLNK